MSKHIKIDEISAISLDSQISLQSARHIVGEDVVLCGNVDPTVLFCDKKAIEKSVRDCIKQGKGYRHVLNTGDGINKNTPEISVKYFVDAAKTFAFNNE